MSWNLNAQRAPIASFLNINGKGGKKKIIKTTSNSTIL